ncbi:hypothetical protein [Campylobacter upsaliensis]|uniref:Periplasmic protein n=1 Tax=Campylobacter upsaliensis TaxID=28080 RepID=A0A381EK89_CAMUP|nr:Uncharacterised protein [Campylobacter upsaliensis]
MKLSYHASKGVSISALLSSVALAKDISINAGNTKNYFDTNDELYFVLKKEHTNSNLNIKLVRILTQLVALNLIKPENKLQMI